jgi:hypothetical protein
LDFSFFLIDLLNHIFFGLESVVAVAFQNVFRSEIHQNNIFFYFKKIFLTLVHQNDLKTPKNINLKKKKLIFFKNAFKTQKQIGSIENHLDCF